VASTCGCERNWDGGLDAYASGELDPEGRGIGLACSITATPAKVEGDAKEAKENYPDLRVLIFSTAKMWAKDLLDKYGLQLVVVPREEFITWLLDPVNAHICRDQLGIAPSMTPELAPALERAREAAKEAADNWDRDFRRTGRPMISLNAVKANEKGEPIEAVTTASLNAVLSEGQRIILEPPAGSGKTTTLVQLARRALDAGGLAFLVDLPDWVRSGKSLLSYVDDRPAGRYATKIAGDSESRTGIQ
jgi:hypothetical protein